IAFSTNLAVADLNGDTKLDVAASTSSSGVKTYLGGGDGSFQPAQSDGVGPHAGSFVVGDFNRDGRPDAASLDAPGGEIGALLGNGDGTLRVVQLLQVSPDFGSLSASDFNGDGWPDLAVGTIAGLQISLNDARW